MFRYAPPDQMTFTLLEQKIFERRAATGLAPLGKHAGFGAAGGQGLVDNEGAVEARGHVSEELEAVVVVLLERPGQVVVTRVGDLRQLRELVDGRDDLGALALARAVDAADPQDELRVAADLLGQHREPRVVAAIHRRQSRNVGERRRNHLEAVILSLREEKTRALSLGRLFEKSRGARGVSGEK